MKFLPLSVLLLSLALPACQRSRHVITTKASTTTPAPTLVEGDFLTAPGIYQYDDGKGSSTTLQLKTSGSTINWEISSFEPIGGGGSTGGTSSSGMTVEGSWFVYVEKIGRLWMFNGESQLDYSLHDHSGGNSGSAIFGGKIQSIDQKVPDAVIRRLPEALRKQFPELPPETVGPRPSI